MPYVKQSWRTDKHILRWISRLLCVISLHHWMKSKTTKEPIVCVVCEKKTPLWHWRRMRRP